jgi:hypothetical protein
MDETPPVAPGTPAPPLAALHAMPYHDEVVALLRRQEPQAWAWASSAAARVDRANEVRAFLLQHTYRLDAEAHPQLHASCAAAAARLGVTAPVTIYQGSEPHSNAALLYLPGEAHIVFNGSLLERLAGTELEAVCGHELAHHLLYERDDGAWFTASRLLGMAQDDPRSDASLRETARLFALHTEAFADRGGAVACGALEPAVAALVKVQTGLAEQVQRRLTALTRRVIGQFLRPHALRSPALLAWARRFFPDAQPADAADPTLGDALAAGVHDYVAALLLDFAVADRSLDDVPFAQAIRIAGELGLAEPFERLATPALKLSRRQFAKARGEADALLAQVTEARHA